MSFRREPDPTSAEPARPAARSAALPSRRVVELHKKKTRDGAPSSSAFVSWSMANFRGVWGRSASTHAALLALSLRAKSDTARLIADGYRFRRPSGQQSRDMTGTSDHSAALDSLMRDVVAESASLIARDPARPSLRESLIQGV